MLAIIGVLLIIWLAIVIIGFVVKSLFWLAIVGIVLFLATAAYGAVRGRAKS